MNVENGKFYRHFKGGLYQVICKAKDSETGEELVIYQALYGTFDIYSRPLKNFCEQLDRKKYPDSAQIYRFEEIDPKSIKKLKEQASEDKKDISGERKGELEEEVAPDSQMPIIMRFLEADSSEAKLDIIKQNYNSLDERTINNIEASLDIVSDSSDLDVRIGYICDVLRTKARYESNRLR
ncbi:MAG: DUF1653 domain-containing protein [Lachnospiraceae bacterium]|nr:DUF1653 domain-containing protein [Lachnospiraceae bacterium]